MLQTITPTQARLHRERMERQQRMAQAVKAHRVRRRQGCDPHDAHVTAYRKRKSGVRHTGSQHDAHIVAYRILQLDTVPVPRGDPIPVILHQMVSGTGFTVAEIIGPRRSYPLTRLRQACMYEIKRRRPDLSLPQIARHMGDRDHTTVLHGIRKHAERLGHPLPGRSALERRV